MFKNYSLIFTLLFLLIGLSVNAEPASYVPFDDVRSDTALGRSVEKRVLFFAHFTCPWCRQSHEYLSDWGDGLPEPYQFEIVPAVGLHEHVLMASAFYAMLQIDATKMAEFIQALYAQLQDSGRNPLQKEAYLNAAARVGVSEFQFNRAIVGERTKQYVQRAAELTRIYNVYEVPSLIVANKYATAPSRVGNDEQLTLSLLNGLVSQDIQMKGYASP